MDAGAFLKEDDGFVSLGNELMKLGQIEVHEKHADRVRNGASLGQERLGGNPIRGALGTKAEFLGQHRQEKSRGAVAIRHEQPRPGHSSAGRAHRRRKRRRR